MSSLICQPPFYKKLQFFYFAYFVHCPVLDPLTFLVHIVLFSGHNLSISNNLL